MKKKKINLVSGNKKYLFELNVVPDSLKWLGLMFSKKEKAKALLFDFKKPVKMSIHSMFISYNFISIWLNSKDEIIEIQKVLPWKFRISPSEKFVKLIEIPFSEKYKDICEKLVEDKRFKY
jgi:uncharacterized membrane protein (UPF0127 family)